jgi:type IV secretory pathway VirB10-like protein
MPSDGTRADAWAQGANCIGALALLRELSDDEWSIRRSPSTSNTTRAASPRASTNSILMGGSNVQPTTITVRPDWPLRVIVHKDLLLENANINANRRSALTTN